MKNFYKMALLLVCLLFMKNVSAAPGDTTWVTSFENLDINHYGNFDISAQFPTNKTYRKIRMHYILGRKSCPAGEQYCGSWDYTTSVVAMPANKDSVELTRIITPYATNWPTTRKHDYIVDVTDYAILLNGNLDLRYIYEGYSWGFTLTLKFEMIEGTPPRNVLEIKNVYDDYYTYGSNTNPIENKLTAKSFTLPANAIKAEIKNVISGHGMDNDGCAEFCSKYYQQKINGTLLEQKQLWKNDCGMNNIYPQTGTWLFDRANWCPGEAVYPFVHTLPNSITGGSTFTADIDMEPYIGGNQSNLGGFNIASQLFVFGANLRQVDASIEAIISPSDDPNYARLNTTCSQPIIRVKNNGATAITSIKFAYTLRNSGIVLNHTWTGNLAFNKEEVIEFPSDFGIFALNQSNRFDVSIVKVNGTAGDEDLTNNDYTTLFKHVAMYPNNFKIEFKTNQAGSNISETSWKIYDVNGNVVRSRENCAKGTTYMDTINLPAGCYTFVMKDGNCDGISWWYYPNYPVNPGNGSLRFVKPVGSASIKSVNGDFGCEYRESFTIDAPLSMDDVEGALPIEIYPNPANDQIRVQFPMTLSALSYQLLDASGKVIRTVNDAAKGVDNINISVNDLQAGIYFIAWNVNDNSKTVTTSKIIVQK